MDRPALIFPLAPLICPFPFLSLASLTPNDEQPTEKWAALIKPKIEEFVIGCCEHTLARRQCRWLVDFFCKEAWEAGDTQLCLNYIFRQAEQFSRQLWFTIALKGFFLSSKLLLHVKSIFIVGNTVYFCLCFWRCCLQLDVSHIVSCTV